MVKISCVRIAREELEKTRIRALSVVYFHFPKFIELLTSFARSNDAYTRKFYAMEGSNMLVLAVTLMTHLERHAVDLQLRNKLEELYVCYYNHIDKDIRVPWVLKECNISCDKVELNTDIISPESIDELVAECEQKPDADKFFDAFVRCQVGGYRVKLCQLNIRTQIAICDKLDKMPILRCNREGFIPEVWEKHIYLLTHIVFCQSMYGVKVNTGYFASVERILKRLFRLLKPHELHHRELMIEIVSCLFILDEKHKRNPLYYSYILFLLQQESLVAKNKSRKTPEGIRRKNRNKRHIEQHTLSVFLTMMLVFIRDDSEFSSIVDKSARVDPDLLAP